MQDVIQALGLLPPPVAEMYAEMLRHAVRAAGQAVLSSDALPPAAPAKEVEPHPIPASPASVVLAAARCEFARGVAEPGTAGMPNGADVIDTYIRGPLGLAWNTCDVKTWKPNVPYTRNGQFAWCGAFAARCWAEAGLKVDLRQKHLAGTGRLYRWAHGTERWVKPRDLRPGDIAVVGPEGSGDGEHITIVREVRANVIETYEGNAHGLGIKGNRYEGVVVQVRPFDADARQTYRVLYGVRPLPEDLVKAVA